MQKVTEYSIFFAVLLLLQVFLFDNISISIYAAPLVYVALLVMLPFNTPHGLLVFIGFAVGIILDFFTGGGGLNTIAATFTGFIRPVVLNITMGRDFWREVGGTLTRGEIRSGRWLRYSALLVMLHCAVYFMFEALTWRYFGYTLLKIALSGMVTMIIVWFIGIIYPFNKK